MNNKQKGSVDWYEVGVFVVTVSCVAGVIAILIFVEPNVIH